MKTELIRGLHNIRARHQHCVLTLGNFDGIHLGHQALLQATMTAAQAMHVPACVMTFEPHPIEYFKPEKMLPRLMRLREKFLTISEIGMNALLVLPFESKLASLTAEAFVNDILIHQLQVKKIIVGEDFHFGKNRRGDVHFLKQIGREKGFSVDVVPAVLVEGERVSSSRVRAALKAADHALVARLLGRPYTLKGRVARGDKRGRILGFPTANIHLHRAMTPVQGIYTVRMHGISPQGLPGVANVGNRPTVDGSRTLLEVHLFDFNQDIYGRSVCVEFCTKLREERRFDNLDLLKEQMLLDAEQARNYFKQ